MPIIVDIWVFVSMISFMLGQVEHETCIFCLIGWILCAVLWEASSCDLQEPKREKTDTMESIFAQKSGIMYLASERGVSRQTVSET